MPLASGLWASYVKPLQPSGNSDALECQRDCLCFRMGSGITAFPIRSSTDNAVNMGTMERLMDSRFALQLLSAFVDETLEMPRQLDVETRLEQNLCCGGSASPLSPVRSHSHKRRALFGTRWTPCAHSRVECVPRS